MYHWIDKIYELKQNGTTYALATICKTKGSGPRKIGTRMIVLTDGNFFGTIGGGGLEKLVMAQAKKCLMENISETYSFPLDEKAGQACGGYVEVTVEVFGANPDLFIFGSGHVGLATCEILKETLFNVNLVDDRAEWLEKSNHAVKHHCHWKDFINNNLEKLKDSFVVVMTPDHVYDQDIAFHLAKVPLKYLGVIGSKSKWKKFVKDLKNRGLKNLEIENITSPIGLVKAGNTPTEVAISLAGQLLDVHYNKNVK